MPSFWEYLLSFRKWIPLFLGIGLIHALLNVGVLVAENVAAHGKVQWVFYSINEFTGAFAILIFIPFLFYLFAKWPLVKPHLWSRLALYLAVSLVFGFLYTSTMYAMRVPLYRMAGITRLHEIFNDLPIRYLMEYFKQFFSFWLIYIVFRVIDLYQSNRKKELSAVQLKEELLRSQIQSLQMQLHPHFFFNTLNTISSLMYHDPGRADKLIGRLSSFLRNALELKDRPMHSLEKEIGLLQQFTDVMLERYPDKLSVTYQIPQELMPAQVPVLLLQPIVENAIQYAIDYRPETRVAICVHESDNYLNIEISDNGPGISEGTISPGTGLTNALSRLQKIYEDNFKFELQNRETGGLTVSISLPNSSQ
jgi:sensor histidine kinase YesM